MFIPFRVLALFHSFIYTCLFAEHCIYEVVTVHYEQYSGHWTLNRNLSVLHSTVSKRNPLIHHRGDNPSPSYPDPPHPHPHPHPHSPSLAALSIFS